LSDTTEIATTLPEVATPEASGLAGRVRALLQNREFKRFSKFFVVGMIGAVIDFSTLHILDATNIFQAVHWQTPFGFAIDELGIVGAWGFTAAVISNFIWNRYWVYPDSRSKSVHYQVVTFFAVNIVGLIIRTPILELLQSPLIGLARGILPTLGADLVDSVGKTFAWAAAVVAVMLWNFFVNRYWTYNDVE
jgi:putative flippase GtrA